MKKFLFTLAALMMMGSAYADNIITMPDQELTAEQLGTSLQIRMSAEFENYVSGFRINFYDLPEGLTVNKAAFGNGAKMDYINEDGDEDTYRPTLMSNAPVFLAASQQQAYDENGNYMGVAHWTPGTHADFLRVTFDIAENFQGGEVKYWVEPTSGGWGDGSNDCPKNSHHELTCTFTVPGEAPLMDLTGEVVIGEPTEDGYVAISYTGTEDVTIRVMIDGVYVPLTDGMVFLGEYGEAEITVEVTAEGYNPITMTKTVTWTAPEPPYETPAPTVNVDVQETQVVITAEGEGTVILYVNGQAVENPYTIARGEEDDFVSVYATAQRDEEAIVGISESQLVLIPALEVAPQPEVTATPTIEVTEGEDAYVVTVVGDGELHLYCNNVEVEFPYTIARGETDVTYYFTATAQEEGKEISATAELEVVVPAKAGEQPEDPHMTGYWLVVIDAQNNLHWNQLSQGPNGDYSTTVGLDCATYGDYIPVEDDSNRPFVPYYFVVDGVVYGAQYEDQPTVLGDAMANPLVAESENYYNVLVGYNYTLGIAIVNGNEYYVYASRAGGVGIDELAEGKQIAGVRYFNMAGQEMQEANGMTIVVTTYTDGTTSAVKVMK